jgi:hypothetical protein
VANPAVCPGRIRRYGRIAMRPSLWLTDFVRGVRHSFFFERKLQEMFVEELVEFRSYLNTAINAVDQELKRRDNAN